MAARASTKMCSNKSIQDGFVCIVVIIMFVGSVQLADGAPEDARVDFFPGYDGTLRSKIYAGYVTVNEAHGRNLFYYFVESEGNPKEDPVILWLTGGPGCSGFSAFVYETGPMYFDVNNYTGGLPKLIDNPHSWTKVSNIIFIDSPVGTGFSYSNTTEDYEYGDFKTVLDLYTFLFKWFEAYPEFLSNPLYISGVSYAGIFVPMLTQKIADGIEVGVKPTMNVKGYLVGNGMADDTFDKAQVPFAHGMGLISDELYKAAKEACDGKYSSPINAACQSKLDLISETLHGINNYFILDPICFSDTTKRESVSSEKYLAKTYEKLEVFDELHEARSQILTQDLSTRFISQDGYLSIPLQLGYLDQPCPSLDKLLLSEFWANYPSVRKAVHAESENIIGVWKRCNRQFKHTRDITSVVKYHKNLTKRGYRALIYNGDHDMAIPFVGTQAWIKSLGYSIVDEWRSWFVDGQVAGYTKTYDNHLTFATIKGAGHTAAEYKPKQSFMMFKLWISGDPL